jgi:hypothetical protein
MQCQGSNRSSDMSGRCRCRPARRMLAPLERQASLAGCDLAQWRSSREAFGVSDSSSVVDALISYGPAGVISGASFLAVAYLSKLWVDRSYPSTGNVPQGRRFSREHVAALCLSSAVFAGSILYLALAHRFHSSAGSQSTSTVAAPTSAVAAANTPASDAKAQPSLETKPHGSQPESPASPAPSPPEQAVAAAPKPAIATAPTPPPQGQRPLPNVPMYGISIGMTLTDARAIHSDSVIKNIQGTNWLTFPGRFQEYVGTVYAQIDDRNSAIDQIVFQYEQTSDNYQQVRGGQTTQKQEDNRASVIDFNNQCEKFADGFPNFIFENYNTTLSSASSADGRFNAEDRRVACSRVPQNSEPCSYADDEGRELSYSGRLGRNIISAKIRSAYLLTEGRSSSVDVNSYGMAYCKILVSVKP